MSDKDSVKIDPKHYTKSTCLSTSAFGEKRSKRHAENEQETKIRVEQVYNVVDSRYLSRLPFIITTNTETMNDKIKRMLKNEIQQM